MPVAITPRSFHPRVELHADGRLTAERDALSAPGDPFASGLEFAAIASDRVGRPLVGAADAPVAWQRRLVERIRRHLARSKHRGDRRLRTESAAATVLLDTFEGARARSPSASRRGTRSERVGSAESERRDIRALRREALAAYLDLLARTRSTRLHESMTANLDRCRGLFAGDEAAEAALAKAWAHVLPEKPPYDAWFPDGDGELRVLCQVQDVFFGPWKSEFRRLGFRPDGGGNSRRIRYVRADRVRGLTTRIVVDYVCKGEGIFTSMARPRTHVVAFLGHSDWWARVPRNLAHAPDQVGEKLLVLIMCFGKHFYHALHERYPRAHLVTTKDPTEDPEDAALLRHLFDGISARKSWAAIRRASIADRTTERNFIFPDDARYVAGVMDEDRDGRLDRFDRFCNIGAPRTLAATTVEESFVPDPPGMHPRGAELDPRELDGGKVFEAALMLNSLSYDNYWLDQVNEEQRVVAGGWHEVAPGDFAATRFTLARQDGREIVRMSVSTRYARAAQPAITAMVVYEGWRWLAGLLPRAQRLAPLDASVMGVMLVAHALANSDYPDPDGVFRAFLRRWGFPAYIRFPLAVKTIETDDRWESGAPRAVTRFKDHLPPAALARWVRLLDPEGSE